MNNSEDLLLQLQQLLLHKKSKAYYASKLGISEIEVNQLLEELKKKETVATVGDLEDFEKTVKVNEDKGTLESILTSTFDPKTVDQLAKLHKIDLSKYKISNYWSKLKSNGKFTSSVFATLKKPTDYTAEDFTKFLSNWNPKNISGGYTLSNDKDKQLVDIELNISDFHLAKKTIKNDTLESKTFDYYGVVTELINNVKANYKIRKLVFPISNDFFHSDNYQNTTTNGTPQDVISWYDEEYEKGFDILANTISYLLEQAEQVEVVLVQGNHDRTKGFFVAHALEKFFQKFSEPQLKFQRHHSTTKAVVLGKTFIGYHHGNSCKLEDLPLLFATIPEFSKGFGHAKYREIHTGDKHHYMAKDVKGVRIQQLPSLSGDDRWHIDNNFINSVRAGIAFVYDPDKGKIAEFESRV